MSDDERSDQPKPPFSDFGVDASQDDTDSARGAAETRLLTEAVADVGLVEIGRGEPFTAVVACSSCRHVNAAGANQCAACKRVLPRNQLARKHGLDAGQPEPVTPAPLDWRQRLIALLYRRVELTEAALAELPPLRLRSLTLLDRALDAIRQMRQLATELAEAAPVAGPSTMSDEQFSLVFRQVLERAYPNLVDLEHVGEAVRSRPAVCDAVYSTANIVGALVADPSRRREVLQALIRHQIDDPELVVFGDDDDALEDVDATFDVGDEEGV